MKDENHKDSSIILPPSSLFAIALTGRHRKRSAQDPAVATAAHAARHESARRDLLPGKDILLRRFHDRCPVRAGDFEFIRVHGKSSAVG
jgi:hypothetical protein